MSYNDLNDELHLIALQCGRVIVIKKTRVIDTDFKEYSQSKLKVSLSKIKDRLYKNPHIKICNI